MNTNKFRMALLALMGEKPMSSLDLARLLEQQGFWLARFRLYFALAYLEEKGKVDHTIVPYTLHVNNQIHRLDRHMYWRIE